MSISLMTSISERDEHGVLLNDADCPDYNAVVNRRLNAHYLNSHDDSRSSIDSLPRALKSMSMTSERHISSGSPPRNPRPLPRHERHIYTYRLLANAAPLHFMISVERDTGKPKPGQYIFRLSLKTNGIERSLGEPTTRTLKVDPRHLNFVVL